MICHECSRTPVAVRKEKSRESIRDREEETASEYVSRLGDYLRPGTRVWTTDLREAVSEWAQAQGRRVPGARRLYAVADGILGPRRVGRARNRFYVIPEGGTCGGTVQVGYLQDHRQGHERRRDDVGRFLPETA